MSQIGQASGNLSDYPALATHCQAAARVNVDRIAVPANDGGIAAGTDMITSVVKGSTAGAATTMAAKQLADYYEWVAERSESVQYAQPT